MKQEEKYYGQQPEFSNFIDLNSSVKLPTANVRVEIEPQSLLHLGLAIFANVLIFWGIYYMIKKD